MKRYLYHNALLACVLLTLVACHDDEHTTATTGGRPVTFVSALGTGQAIGGQAAQSRASDNMWQAYDRIGIYRIDPQQPDDIENITFKNVCYQTQGAGQQVTLDPLDEMITYPEDGSKVNFIAYHPYRTELVPAVLAIDLYNPELPVPLVYPVDVRTQNPFEAIDLLYHSAVNGIEYTPGEDDYNIESGPVTLNFRHVLSKITICLEIDPRLNPNLTPADIDLSLRGFPTQGEFVPGTGIFWGDVSSAGTPDAPSVLVPIYDAGRSTATAFYYDAILTPHRGKGIALIGRKLSLTVGSETRTYDFGPMEDFRQGMHYTHQFNLTKLIQTGMTVNSWDTETIAPPTLLQVMPEALIALSSGSVKLSVRTTSQTPLTAGHIQISRYPDRIEEPEERIARISGIVLESTSPDGWSTYAVTVEYPRILAIDRRPARICYLHITLGDAKAVIQVTKEATPLGVESNTTTDMLSNCYIVQPESAVAIPIDRAYRNSQFAGLSLDNLYPVVLWDDRVTGYDNSPITLSPFISNYGSYVFMANVGPGAGNAGVAIREGLTGPILWSWHLWITDYDPSMHQRLPDADATDYVFMDRNLGATDNTSSLASYGLLYQWGRKDPFPNGMPGAAGYAARGNFYGMPDCPDNVSRPISEEELLAIMSTRGNPMMVTVQNPTRFYANRDNTYIDWYGGASAPMRYQQNNTLWGHGFAMTSDGGGGGGDRLVVSPKSMYDPCPEGWRVPSFKVSEQEYPSDESQSPWRIDRTYAEDMEAVGGISFDDGATLYPLAGRRLSSGLYEDGGGGVFCYSASPGVQLHGDSHYAAGMSGISGDYNGVSSSFSRAYAASVRCVREENHWNVNSDGEI